MWSAQAIEPPEGPPSPATENSPRISEWALYVRRARRIVFWGHFAGVVLSSAARNPSRVHSLIIRARNA